MRYTIALLCCLLLLANTATQSAAQEVRAAADTVRPTVVSVSPAPRSSGEPRPASSAAAADVAISVNVTAVFSEQMSAATINRSTFVLTKRGTSVTVPAAVQYQQAARRAVLNPLAELEPNTTYVATIKSGPSGAKDLAGNPLASDRTWTLSTSGPGGLTGHYYDNRDFTGLKFTRVDSTINHNWRFASPDPRIGQDQFTVRWVGQVKADFSETYRFFTNSDDGVRLWVNGEKIIEDWTERWSTENTGTIALQADQWYPIVLEYLEAGGEAAVRLSYSSPRTRKQVIPGDHLKPMPGTNRPVISPQPAPNPRPAPGGVPAPKPAPGSTGDTPTNLALFYHPPTDGTSVQTAAQRFDSVVFTRGDEGYRDQMRGVGFDGPALQYLMANEASGPLGLRNAADPCGTYLYYPNNVSGIAGDFCAALHRDERNFLHNGRGERLYSTQSWVHNGRTITVAIYQMNPASPAWREYFSRRAQAQIQELGYNGLFLDNVDISLFRGQRTQDNADGKVAEYAESTAFRTAVSGFLSQLRSQVGSRAKVWANMTASNDQATDWDA